MSDSKAGGSSLPDRSDEKGYGRALDGDDEPQEPLEPEENLGEEPNEQIEDDDAHLDVQQHLPPTHV